MKKHIQEMFPEITKAVQQRRALYYIWMHQYHFVKKLLKKGQIEDREAKELMNEID